MPVNYHFSKGIDLPNWQWCSPFLAGISSPGSACAYDGSRYMYWVIQFGAVSATASTTQLWRYDTWSNGWQFMATTVSGNAGVDVEYDSVRNVLWIIVGSALTGLYVFNLNTVAVTLANVACPPWVLTTMPVLPVGAAAGASLTMPDATAVPNTLDTGTTMVGSTATALGDSSDAVGTFGSGMIGLQVRFTSGALLNQRRIITAVPDPIHLTVNAFGAAPAVGDTYVVELPTGSVTTGGSTTTLTDAGQPWIVNAYSNQDIVMTSGAAAGQRRRIASNTATVITLAAAVTGNARTGPFSATPAVGDTYQIVPSNDYLYFHPGNGSTALYRLDVVQTTGAAWSASMAAAPGAIGPGSNTFYPAAYAPFNLVAFRGAATAGFYLYNMGLNTWLAPTVLPGAETFTTGCSAAMVKGHRKIFIQKESSQRCYFLDMTTGLLEPAGFMPYAAPVAYDGKRAKHVVSPDGAEWIYLMRSGGSEFFRVPLEWL